LGDESQRDGDLTSGVLAVMSSFHSSPQIRECRDGFYTAI